MIEITCLVILKKNIEQKEFTCERIICGIQGVEISLSISFISIMMIIADAIVCDYKYLICNFMKIVPPLDNWSERH
jgi:hypothetical protein